jgi:predicted ArsR family transcriptional regulator
MPQLASWFPIFTTIIGRRGFRACAPGRSDHAGFHGSDRRVDGRSSICTDEAQRNAMTSTDSPADVHHALADERRALIVRELHAAPDGLDADALAGLVGLHPSTVRFHLGVLADAGLVTSAALHTRARGRPRVRYSAVPAHDDAAEYRLLAGVLARAVAELDDGADRAEQAGRAWGRHLVEAPPPLAPPDAAATVGAVVDLLARQGFEPECLDGEIRMHRCPYLELGQGVAPRLACAAHRGLVAGALAELDGGIAVDGLDVFPRPGVCVLRLRGTGSSAA